MMILAVVVPQEPWIHALDPNVEANRTMCGLDRSVPSRFHDTKTPFLDVIETPYSLSHTCGICWWKYRHATRG